MDRFAGHVGVLVLALVAVGGFAAVVWQIVHGQTVDPLLAGMVTGAIGVLSPSPLKQTVQVDQPHNDPIPVDAHPDAGFVLLDVLIVLLIVAVCVWLALTFGWIHPR